MNKKIHKWKITACTLVDLQVPAGVGRFCEWFKADSVDSFSGLTSFIKIKSNNFSRRLTLPYFHTSYWFSEVYGHKNVHLKPEDNYVLFCLREEKHWGKYDALWQFVFNNNTLREIAHSRIVGQYIQLFDITFDQKHPCNYPDFYVDECDGIKSGLSFPLGTHDWFCYGLVDNHRSMTLDRYGEITGTDPVMVHARQNYYDPICHDWFLMGGITFEAYLDQYRSRFGQA